jgi:15-cis-phytoene synthase
MELYDKIAYANSRHLTLSYSSSFGISSRLFSKSIQPHIYAIYGLVRIADEIVDTYRGPDAAERLNQLETATYNALETGFDVNPIIHAFALTARKYSITKDLIAPFFASMRMDLPAHSYHPDEYKQYIYGSAEVVGLMCLRVFTDRNAKVFDTLRAGASALGSAYQKINFLRDLAADYKELGRLYFPNTSYETFDETAKVKIIKDIRADLKVAYPSLVRLPKTCRSAVMTSFVYYSELLRRLEATPTDIIKHERIRVPSHHKVRLLGQTLIKERLRS